MKKIVFILMSFSFVLVALSSCSCSTGEEYASRLYDVNVDMDGDGDAGDRGGEYNNVSFKGGERVTLTNKPCDVCDCTVYTGWYKGYYTDCDCGHAYGVH